MIAPSFQVVVSASSTATKCPSTILQPSEVANLDLDMKLSLSQLLGDSVVLRLLLITPQKKTIFPFLGMVTYQGLYMLVLRECKNVISRFLQKMPDSRLCDFVLMSFFKQKLTFPNLGRSFWGLSVARVSESTQRRGLWMIITQQIPLEKSFFRNLAFFCAVPFPKPTLPRVGKKRCSDLVKVFLPVRKRITSH